LDHRVGTQALSDLTMALFERLLDFRAERHTLIASNLAHAETPRYQAMDREFEGALKSVMAASRIPVTTLTHPRHLPIQTGDRVAISPRQVPRKSSSIGGAPTGRLCYRPRYAEKLKQIIQRYQLTAYDHVQQTTPLHDAPGRSSHSWGQSGSGMSERVPADPKQLTPYQPYRLTLEVGHSLT
jgi:hypothetical protein